MPTPLRLLQLTLCTLLAAGARGGLYERLFGQSASICEDVTPLGTTCICPRQRSRLYQGADCSARNISTLPQHLPLPQGVPTVSFEQNRLTTLQQNQFIRNAGVKTLKLSKNRIGSLQAKAFAQLPGLETLLLDKNQLTDIDQSAFEGLSSLTRLDLGFNELRSLPPELFSGTAIRELQLHYNPLVTLDPSLLFYLPQLQILDLDSTDLTSLPGGLFVSNQELITLLLPHNQLTAVPTSALGSAGALRTLDLSGNQMQTIPSEAFRAVPGLRRLVLSSMHELSSVDAYAFSGLDELEELLCQFNDKLTKLDPAAFKSRESGKHLSKLDRVDLKEDGLSYVAKDTLPWESMSFVDMEMNPWNCDCEMSWVADAEYNFEHEPLFKCEQPAALKGKPLAILTSEQFVCEDEGGNIALVVFLALLGVAAAAALVFVVWKFKLCQKAQAKLFVRPKYANVRREVDKVEVEGMEWDNGDIGV